MLLYPPLTLTVALFLQDHQEEGSGNPFPWLIEAATPLSVSDTKPELPDGCAVPPEIGVGDLGQKIT